jgi:Zn-dependent peptidase ImmA (M78 family)
MAVAYKRPLAVFYLPEPPQGFTPLKDFRTLPGMLPSLESPSLALETRRAHQRRETALDLAKLMAEDVVSFELSATIADNPRVVAEQLRTHLGITIEDQSAWRDEYVALNSWKAAVERAGILVSQTEKLPMSEARGFSLALLPLPIVVVNSKDSPRGRIFTLLHELAHVLLRASGVCDLHESSGSKRDVDVVEVFCNRVAGHTLVPESSLSAALARLELSGESEWLDPELRRLADFYSVSPDAALRSLVQAGQYPAHLYAKRHAAFVSGGDSKKRKSGPVPYYRRALGWSGRRFAGMVLAAYDDRRISSADLTEYLRVKMRQVEQIRGALRKGTPVDTA